MLTLTLRGEVMPSFMIAYHGGDQPKSKEEGMEQMAKWKTWLEGLGEAVVNPGTPLTATKVVTSQSVLDEDSPDALEGFAVVRADNIEAAIEIAQADPFLSTNGTIRISQMVEMN
jgi:hypothetical protein